MEKLEESFHGVSTVADLVRRLQSLSEYASLDTIYITDCVDLLVYRETLTDGSAVYNIRLRRSK